MMRGIQKIADIDPSIIAGGAAGIGAYSLAKKIPNVAVASPFIAGAVTALLVGAMVASKVRAQAQQPTFSPRQAQFQQDGFLPGERVNFPVGHSYYK